jgi:hypothetical protein
MVVSEDGNGRAAAPKAEAMPKRKLAEVRNAVVEMPEQREELAAGPADDGLYLIGRPTLKGFLRHIQRNAADPPSERELVDQWSAANRVACDLERSEAGLADDPPIIKMGPEYKPLLIELLRDPLIRHGFNTVPTDVALVDLDRMVVYQKHIDLTFVAQQESRLPADPTPDEIFRLCLPHDHPRPPVQWSRVRGDNKYVFVSPSNDLRFLGVMPLESDDIPEVPPPGNLVGVVGVAVGFGSNFLNAIYAEKRLILRNGSHRAYLLRKRGITRVPCIIQHVRSREELELVGSSELSRHPDLYLRNPRPPMLRDYFHPELHKTMRIRRRLTTVTVSFHAEENEIPVV